MERIALSRKYCVVTCVITCILFPTESHFHYNPHTYASELAGLSDHKKVITGLLDIFCDQFFEITKAQLFEK